MMRFQFNLDKAVKAMAYVLERIGTTDKVKLMKLMYLADREHFIQRGYPLTGDRQCAMPWGPVPSQTLSAVNGEMPGAERRVFAFIHLDDVKMSLRQSPGVDGLSDFDREILDIIVRDHGSKNTWDLVKETHRLPEYKEWYSEGTSRTIPYESIARVSGSDSRFRKNRPVITRDAALQMACPFPPGSDV